jgi:hypothetical protein
MMIDATVHANAARYFEEAREKAEEGGRDGPKARTLGELAELKQQSADVFEEIARKIGRAS